MWQYGTFTRRVVTFQHGRIQNCWQLMSGRSLAIESYLGRLCFIVSSMIVSANCEPRASSIVEHVSESTLWGTSDLVFTTRP